MSGLRVTHFGWLLPDGRHFVAPEGWEFLIELLDPERLGRPFSEADYEEYEQRLEAYVAEQMRRWS
jgi:hypothetical protein